MATVPLAHQLDPMPVGSLAPTTFCMSKLQTWRSRAKLTLISISWNMARTSKWFWLRQHQKVPEPWIDLICRDTSKNNTKQLAEVYLDYAKTTIVGNSTDNDNILDCKLRRQDKDLKCRGAGVKSQPVKLYPKRTKAVIRPLTVRNITLSGPYPNNEQHCSILFDVVNPNPDALTSFNAESEPQLLRNKKRDFGVCQYSFPCGSRGSDSSSGHPRCSNDFGHDLNWRFSINDLGILDLYWTISKGHNVTIAAIDTRWSSNLRADRHECGKTCVIDCGSEGCGKCSNGVCSWGGFDRMVDDLTITPRYKWPNIWRA